MLHCLTLKYSTITCFSLGSGGGGDLHLFFKMLTNPESLMQHNLENRFGIFVEISRNIISSLKALISKKKKTTRKNITLSDPVMVVECVLIRCSEMRLKMIFLGNIEFLFSFA